MKEKKFETVVRSINNINERETIENGTVITIKMNFKNEYLIENISITYESYGDMEKISLIKRDTLQQLKQWITQQIINPEN